MDVDTFKSRYLGFHPKLYRIALALTDDAAESEDLLQELYAKLWSRRAGLETVQNPEAFAVALLKNLCIDYLRSPRGTPGRMVGIDILTQAEAGSETYRPEEADEVKRVKQLIDRLPDNQRTVIRLRAMGDCSTTEIAGITGLTETNIRSLLLRARRSIKEKLYPQTAAI
ncbi:MAG: RNA polymerase sigma factor [Prevotellaceae bacterium]|nr:RNA polymerase sigma factor [Prevotellaceae bacterium]